MRNRVVIYDSERQAILRRKQLYWISQKVSSFFCEPSPDRPDFESREGKQDKQHEGVSFSDYVMREKIALAKSLLIYSQSSYAEIAATLGFFFQSHMGKHFKGPHRHDGHTVPQALQRHGA